MKSSFRFQFLFFGLFLGVTSISYASILTEYEHRDLQLFHTYQQKPGLIASINRTHTKMGYSVLKDQLANPLDSIDQLTNRQNIIKLFLNNANLYNSLISKLKEFANYESSITKSWQADTICDNVIGNFYFKNKYLAWLNKYPAGLELGQVAHIANLSAPLIEHAIIHFLISEKLQDTLGISCGHSHHSHGPDCNHAPASSGAVFAYNTYNVLHTLIHLAGVKGLFDHVKQQADVIKTMQEDLMHMRNCLEHALAIYEELETQPELARLLPGFAAFRTLFVIEKNTVSSDLEEFLALIGTTTFDGQPSYLSRQGVILRAYALAQKVHTELQEKLSAIAAVDFHISSAQLMNEYANTRTPFSFAHYHQQTMPLLNIQGFWNPLIVNMQSIQEPICLGSNNPHVAIVTGPNKAGKSTSLNALCVTTILAQTLGIVPANECHITPFSCIRTGFNMTNRVMQGQSLFSASLDFANELIDYAESHKDQHMFIALDEIFNSTDSARGSAIARRFVYALGASSNCIALVATHFGSLTELEAENTSLYKNFRAELVLDYNHPRYILEPGISQSDEVLRLIQQDSSNEVIRFI